MARVHVYSSYTQPYNYNQGPEDIYFEEPTLLLSATEEEVEGDIIANTTIEEQPWQQNVIASSSSTSLSYIAATALSNQNTIATEQQQAQQDHETLADRLGSSSAALTAALLQSAHGNDDVVGAVAAALSVKPDSFDMNQQVPLQSNHTSPMDTGEKGEDVIDQAAAASALQLLGLATSQHTKEITQQKIRSDQELQQSSTSATVTNEASKNGEDDNNKALPYLETTDWNDIALKITEKTREGDQHAIEALLSQALMGAVAEAANTASTSSTISPHPSPGIVTPTTAALQHDSNASTPTTPALAAQQIATITPPPPPSSTTTTDNDGLTLNFNNTTCITFADAAALAIYAQQLSQNDANSTSASPQLAALVNHPYFLAPFTASSSSDATTNDTNNATAVAAVASAEAQHQIKNESSTSSSPTTTTTTTTTTVTVGQKRRRSDPALADTQSAAMTIYASATPITTTVNNTTQTVYPCLFPSCGKTFARLYNLKSHSRTHTDDRPFVCHACTAAFSRNHDLKRHSKIHGGNKPYLCEGCNKSFSRLDALKRHKSNQRNKQGCTEENDISDVLSDKQQ